MALLFRANASTREKLFTLLVLAWCVLAIYGMTNSFVPQHWVKLSSAYAAVPLALVFFVPLLVDRHPSNKLPTFGTFKRISVYLILLAFSYGLAFTGLALGAASLATRFLGQESSNELKVVWKSDGRSKRRQCDHSLQVQSLDSDWNARICVDASFWQTVKRGDVLRAKGRYSSLGGMVEELSAL